jgi:tetratricopeptide (TPR) repeat protein
MKPESIAFTVAGMCFGVILGWVLAVQQTPAPRSGSAATDQSPSTQNTGVAQRAPRAVDEARVRELVSKVNGSPGDAEAAVELANLYFDAERWDDAIEWYERALSIDPNDADVSTDLAVSYYYTNRVDRALTQFERSLEIDPAHTKTMLNKGIVLAFGRQDLRGAAAEWQRVVELAPDSPEGQTARRALEGVAAAHSGDAGLSTSDP